MCHRVDRATRGPVAAGGAPGPLLAVKVKVPGVLVRDDDYAGPGKASCDWGDPAARGALVPTSRFAAVAEMLLLTAATPAA